MPFGGGLMQLVAYGYQDIGRSQDISRFQIGDFSFKKTRTKILEKLSENLSNLIKNVIIVI